MELKGNKTYYFTATLNPAEYCRDFDPGELYLGKGYRLDIYFNGITIWNPSIKANFVKVDPFIRQAFDIIIPAFIFREQVISKKILRLSFHMHRCIEAMKVKAEHNLIWTLDYPTKGYSANKRSRINVTWRRVAKFFPKISESIHHKLMLKDYQDCINDTGDNAFFFAYRIIEDIRQAINLEKGILNEQCWDELHKALKTSKNYIYPLTEISTKIRHGNLRSDIVVRARRGNRKRRLLNIAFNLMEREFRRKFPGFL